MKTILFYLAVTTAALGAMTPTEWKNAQSLDVKAGGLTQVALPPSTLDAARDGLEDLRILDSRGNEVPYTIVKPVRRMPSLVPPKKITTTLEGDATVILIETGVDFPLDAVTLETPARGFIKSVSVEGSNDKTTWTKLTSGQPIFRQANGVAHLRAGFDTAKWAFLRLRVDDQRAEAVPFTGAWLHGVTSELAKPEPLPVTITERAENDSATRLTLNLGAANLRLASLRIETDEPLFTRAVSVAVRQVMENAVTERVLARETIYRVAVEGQTPTSHLDAPLDISVPSRELLVTIENLDNPPLAIKSVSVQCWPVFAVFRATETGAFRVLTGNARCAAPRYDLAALKNSLSLAPLLESSKQPLGALTANPQYQPGEPLPEIQDIGTALDASAWKHRARVQIGKPGVQQLDLSLDALAGADRSFRDLRLVRDGKQRPYIIERTSISRKLTPESAVANDPKRPKVSRWKLTLPNANLPVTQMTCGSVAPLFKRHVEAFEWQTDAHGEKRQRRLGSAEWVRTPATAQTTLRLWLNAPPQSDTIFLETDNGDNPAIELSGFQLFYPVTRLWFKAPVSPETWLYFGNNETGAPQYDLDLIAPQLMASEKTSATLGAAESLKNGGVGDLFQMSNTKSILFWVSLAVVVVVLMVVVTKLLPKPPAAAK
jgi:hypothetical protein